MWLHVFWLRQMSHVAVVSVLYFIYLLQNQQIPLSVFMFSVEQIY